MRVHIRLFARLRELSGARDALDLDLPGSADVATALAALGERYPALRGPIESAAFAVNRTYVNRLTPLRDGDELAILPPVSGGAA